MDINKNAELVFVDKKIIAEAPTRYIVSGMVDTLAKWVETRAYTKNIKEKNVQLEIAIFLAKKAYDDILRYGKQVLEDLEQNRYTKEVELVIDHIILTAGLVGGIGGAACRAVAAHAINNGFTVLPSKYKKMLHGEVVGFGNIVQMVLDNEKEEEILELLKLYKNIGAPIGLEDLGFGDISEKEMERVVNKSLYKEDTMWNLPYKVDFDKVKTAIEQAEELCKRIKKL
jgi:glycerol dehydrogenase